MEVVRRLWAEWQLACEEATQIADALAAAPPETTESLLSRQEFILRRLSAVEEALSDRLKGIGSNTTADRIRLEIAIRRAQILGEDQEPHWQLVADTLRSITVQDQQTA